MTDEVCFEFDDFLQSRYYTHPMWVATLSDGRKVYGDDDRPGRTEPSAWIRLASYLRQNQLAITAIELRFRSNFVEAAPPGAASYFLRRGLLGWMSGVQQGIYLVGHQEKPGDLVQVTHWSSPELTVMERSHRDPTDERGVGPSLIVNP